MKLQIFASYALMALLLLTLHAGAVWTGMTPVLNGEMPDTDTYMRLVRVQELVEGGGWFNSTTQRMNAPYGDTLNWTRPLDVLIVAFALPLHQQLDMEWRDALFWGGAILPPVLQLLFGLAAAWAVAPFFAPVARPLLLLFVCLQPIVFAYSFVGRPDHQTLLLIAAAMLLGFVMRAIRQHGPALRLGLWGGLWAGFGLWVSTEFEFSLALVTGTLALMWLWQGQRRLIELLEGIAIGFLLMTFAGVLAERGMNEWSHVRELDKISLSQLIGACIHCGLWGMTGWLCPQDAGIGRRTLALSSMGAAALFLLVLLAPELLRGPAGDIDPQVMEKFFLNIREMRSIWPNTVETFSLTLLCLGVPLLALPLWLVVYRRDVLSPWLPWLVFTLGFTAIGFMHARFAQFAAPFGAVLLMAVVVRLGARLEGRVLLVRVVAQAGLLFLPLFFLFLALSLLDQPPKDEASCRIKPVSEALNSLSRGIMLSSLNYGPELIYFTSHDTVAGPYHRNTKGILDSIAFFGEISDSAAKDILRTRGIAYILACPDSDATPETMSWKLTHGEFPAWLEPLALPEDQDFRLFQVNQAVLNN